MSCGAGKGSSKAAKIPKPEWVESLPYNSSYYQAVGIARKTGSPQIYRAQAHENALAAMAGQVNANISSTSILHQVEDRTGVSETLINFVRSQSDELMEGYELMEQWEDELNYYEYYRLSKIKFAELKAKRKQSAVNKARMLYEEGVALRQDFNLAGAFTRFTLVLDAMSNYLGDSDEAENTENGNPARKAMKQLDEIVKELVIAAISGYITAHRGDMVDAGRLQFVVSDGAKHGINAVPVQFKYSGGYLRTDAVISNSDGMVNGAVHQTAVAGKYKFCATVDVRKMVQQSTPNLLIRKLLDHLSGNSACVQITIN